MNPKEAEKEYMDAIAAEIEAYVILSDAHEKLSLAMKAYEIARKNAVLKMRQFHDFVLKMENQG